MIDNGDVLRWSEPVEQSYQNAVDRLIVNISRHLKSGKAIHTAKWETQKLSEMGQLTAENAKIINDALKQMPQQMRDALDDTAKESLKLVDEAIEEAIQKGAVERSPISSTQGVIDELSQQALDQFNLVNTTMLQSTQKAYLKAINDTVMWENQMLSAKQKEATLETLNDATTAVLSGGETRQVALRRAIKELNDHGLYGFVDKAGRHWSPEAYVNMCMRTTVHNVAVRSVRGRQEEYGSSIFQCSYHPASRTEHYPFQNKFYDWNGQSGTFTDGNGQKHKYESVTVTGYGTAAGLFGINCGHLPLPQIPGVTIPTDPDMQSPERDEKDYKESQIQRRLERNIRQSKRLVDAYKAAGDDKGAEEAMDAVSMDQAKMREFIERTGRHRRYDREQISGYGPDKLNRPRPKKKPAPKPEPPKPKTPTTQLKVENFPDAFNAKAEKKNTQKLVDYINSKASGANQTVVDLYNSIRKAFSLPGNGFDFKISHGKNHAFSTTYSFAYGDIRGAKLIIPKLDDSNGIGAMNTTLHETMHMMDMYLREIKRGHYAISEEGDIADKFTKVITKNKTVTLGNKTEKLFKEFNETVNKLDVEQFMAASDAAKAVEKQFYPDGKIDIWSDMQKYEKMRKARNKAMDQVYDDYDWKKRAVMGGGVDGLQDIYDALSGGNFQNNGVVKYGHGKKYFLSEANRKSEILANYGALSVSRPDLVEVLKEEQPELVEVLEELTTEMLKKVNE